MRSQLSSFSCALIGYFLFRVVDASCYYPDGSFPEDYVYTACSDSGDSSCCILSEGNQCLSNGLCYSTDTGTDYMYRGGCTDSSWKSGSCFQHCNNASDTWSASSWDQLVPCGGDKYCCSSDSSTCCNDDSKVFTVESASVIKDLGATGSATLPIQTGTATAATGTAKPTKSANTAAASTSTSTADPNADPHDHNHSPSTAVLIGAAVGGVVVLIAAVALVWFFVRRRYRKKLAAGTNAQSFPMSSDGFQKLPDKSPRPVEVPAPLHSPVPPPAYAPPQHNAVEIDNSYLPPGRNQWGNPVYEAPAQSWR